MNSSKIWQFYQLVTTLNLYKNMSAIEQFKREKMENIKKMVSDEKLKSLALKLLIDSQNYNYTYNFNWLGRPIIQLPQDIAALQEIIWKVKPDLIVETGIAHGGGLIFYASMLELIGKGNVLGIDIDIRDHNQREIETHPMYKRIKMIQGSSVNEDVAANVAEMARGRKTMIILDSLHTHDHVLEELNLYSNLVSVGSYLVVFDTVVEYMPKNFFKNRPWGQGNNPATAVAAFLKTNNNFIADMEIENKLLITSAPGGYLKRIS